MTKAGDLALRLADNTGLLAATLDVEDLIDGEVGEGFSWLVLEREKMTM